MFYPLLSFRGLFIIDDKGVLRQITMNDLPVGRSVDETLRLVQAFQYTDKHGEGTAVIKGLLHPKTKILSLITYPMSFQTRKSSVRLRNTI